MQQLSEVASSDRIGLVGCEVEVRAKFATWRAWLLDVVQDEGLYAQEPFAVCGLGTWHSLKLWRCDLDKVWVKEIGGELVHPELRALYNKLRSFLLNSWQSWRWKVGDRVS